MQPISRKKPKKNKAPNKRTRDYVSNRNDAALQKIKASRAKKHSLNYRPSLQKHELQEDDDGLATFTLEVSTDFGSHNEIYSEQFATDRYGYTNRQPTTAQIKSEGDACWKPKGVSVKIAGIEIPLGMIYVGTKLRAQKYGGVENCLINPKFKVARNNDGYDSDDIGYWPSYEGLQPRARREYLLWLASGAKTPNANISFVFLYFYGLERRLFLEQAIDERPPILKEMKRLLRIYGDNNSLNRYVNNAISFATIFETETNKAPALKIPKYSHWELPMSVALYLGRKVKSGDSLTNNDALLWFLNHPEKHLRTPAHRLKKEFISLMKIKLKKAQPDGPKVRKPKRKFNPEYSSCSSSFSVNFKKHVEGIPDFSGIKAPISVVQKFADEAMDELDKLSRLLGRTPEAKGTFKALRLLPHDLLNTFGGSQIKEIQHWVKTRQKGSLGVFTFQEIIEKTTDLDGSKVTKSIHSDVFSFMESLGWSMLPAPHEVIGTVKSDVKLLLLPSNSKIRITGQPTNAMLLAILEISLGSYIAHSDEKLLDVEVGVLIKRIKDFNELSSNERSRLYDLLKWLAIQKLDLSAINRKLKKLDSKAKTALADIAIAVAVVDGKIAPEEVKALESVYKALGFDQNSLYSSLHSMGASKRKTPSHTSTPAKSNEKIGVSLDMERVASTLIDTKKAAALLAEIFEDGDEEVIDALETTPDTETSDNAFQGLDSAHTQLLIELLERTEWPKDEYDLLVSSLKLLPDGAMEAINEWAFEKFDDALIEDGEPIIIYKELLTEGEPQ